MSGGQRGTSDHSWARVRRGGGGGELQITAGREGAGRVWWGEGGRGGEGLQITTGHEEEA